MRKRPAFSDPRSGNFLVESAGNSYSIHIEFMKGCGGFYISIDFFGILLMIDGFLSIESPFKCEQPPLILDL